MASLFVDKYYDMDPQFEDLLPDGTYLQDGMVVLLEDSMLRADPSRAENVHEIERAKEANRWATVSHVKVTKRWAHNEHGDALGETSPLVSFVATYGDGTKKKRSYDASYAWIVKLDSMSK